MHMNGGQEGLFLCNPDRHCCGGDRPPRPGLLHHRPMKGIREFRRGHRPKLKLAQKTGAGHNL